MEAKRIEISAFLRASHRKSDIVTLAVFFLHLSYSTKHHHRRRMLRCSHLAGFKMSSPNVTTRLFCLLNTGSTVNVFESEKMRI